MNLYRRALWLGAMTILVSSLVTPGQVVAQDANDEVRIERVDLGSGLAMLVGQGGNLALSAGADGTFLIDDQYAPLSEKILASISEFTDHPLRFVLNTHWHADHTGGNANMSQAGALIVAQDNVRRRLSTAQVSELWDRTTPPSPPEALPIVTFGSDLTFHVNGQTIQVFHAPHAHTDGDAIVHFVEADLFHTGDVFFNGLYPFVDAESGGSLTGTLSAVDRLLGESSDDTRFIPGHGPLASRQDLVRYREMLGTVAGRVAAAREKGLDLAAFLATNPTAEYDEAWGHTWLSGEKFLEILYTGSTVEDHHHD